MGYQLGVLAACAAVFVYAYLRRGNKKFAMIRDVQGPANPSWIFGMVTFLLPRLIVLNLRSSKDTSGISRPRKLEDQRSGTLGISGTLFIGTVRLGYVPPLIGQTLGSCVGFFTKTVCVYVQEDRLWVVDPKAINHILHKSGYLYAKPTNIQERGELLTGRGIIWAEGEPPIAIDPPFQLFNDLQATYTSATEG